MIKKNKLALDINSLGRFSMSNWSNGKISVGEIRDSKKGNADWIKVKEFGLKNIMNFLNKIPPIKRKQMTLHDVGCNDGFLTEKFASLKFKKVLGSEPRSSTILRGKKIRKILNQEESEHSLSELMNLPYEEEKYYSHSLNKGMNIYNLIGSMTDFSVSKFPEFNRKDINLLDDFDFHYIETIEDYYSPVVTIDGDDLILNKNFHFQGDIKKLEEISKKLFNKGYFISDIGMMRYIHENKIHRQDITFPDWFEVHNDIEFKKMLNFISLMVL